MPINSVTIDEVSARAATASGTRILDTGPAIDLRSLRLVGTRLSWRNGAGTRSAVLD